MAKSKSNNNVNIAFIAAVLALAGVIMFILPQWTLLDPNGFDLSVKEGGNFYFFLSFIAGILAAAALIVGAIVLKDNFKLLAFVGGALCIAAAVIMLIYYFDIRGNLGGKLIEWTAWFWIGFSVYIVGGLAGIYSAIKS